MNGKLGFRKLTISEIIIKKKKKKKKAKTLFSCVLVYIMISEWNDQNREPFISHKCVDYIIAEGSMIPGEKFLIY